MKMFIMFITKFRHLSDWLFFFYHLQTLFMTEKRVWVFKEKKQDNKDEYYNLLIQNNYIPEFIPVLDYELCNIDILKDILSLGPNHEAITGLILTSQKSVHTLNKACELLDVIPEPIRTQWAHLPVYIVGPQTEQLLARSSLFQKNSRWIQAPNAAQLIQPMIADISQHSAEKDGRLLFLAGDKRRDLIPQALDKANIPFRELQSYATCAHPDLLNRLRTLETQDNAHWAVYFSPSGLKFIKSSLPTSKLLLSSNKIKIAAIGPTTADYIKQLNLFVHVVAEKPDPQHLINAIVQYDACQ